ncbi:MAG: hypothetical protein EZS28_029499 [Streblomastix strix]|uniref:Uncharacterized protein n=1 Tax=Streblomastix strix TaxID=222440 RepID=A0A5J4UXM7_9EUKA|nr:MAG: hypothetical protein EZS28_029499 [Streblomastix strix]
MATTNWFSLQNLVAAQPQLTFVNVFCQNIEIDPLDHNLTIAAPEEVPPNAITAARALLAGLSEQDTSQIDFYAEKPLEGQVINVKQHAIAATDLVTSRKAPKHNNLQAQPMLAFDQVLAVLETKLMQHIYDTIYKVRMTRELMDTTEQGNLLKTQPSPVIRPWNNNKMFRSLRALPLTEGVHPTSKDTLLIRINGFTGEFDQEPKKLTAQQVIDPISTKPEIMPPEWAQDLARKPTPETQLIAFLPLLSQLQQQSLNPFTPLNPFYNQPPNNRYRDNNHYIQFPVIPPLNPFFPTVNPQQTISDSRLPNNENERDQQGSIQPSLQMEQAAIQTVERPRQSATSIRSVYNMLIPPIPAYLLQQTSRIALLPYTTERNQQQRQSKRSISPTYVRVDQSEEDDFLDEIIPGITMPHLPLYRSEIKTAQ